MGGRPCDAVLQLNSLSLNMKLSQLLSPNSAILLGSAMNELGVAAGVGVRNRAYFPEEHSILEARNNVIR